MTIAPDRLEILVDKAEYVESCLGILAEKQAVDLEEFATNTDLRDIVERRFVKMTQACIDIARMLLSDLDIMVPQANPDTMRRLGREGVLSSNTARQMAEACGFRNILAHEYGEIIAKEMVFDALQDLRRYRQFLVDIRDFLADTKAI